jgi:hypothetical protein
MVWGSRNGSSGIISAIAGSSGAVMAAPQVVLSVF